MNVIYLIFPPGLNIFVYGEILVHVKNDWISYELDLKHHCTFCLLSKILPIAKPNILPINGASILINLCFFGFSITCSFWEKWNRPISNAKTWYSWIDYTF